jgi:hypothetical protein
MADHTLRKHRVRLEVREKEKLVNLFNRSYDPDARLPPLLQELFGVSVNLRYDWFVNGQRFSSDKDCSVRLPVGEHTVGLGTSDGRREGYREKVVVVPESLSSSIVKTVTVDPAALPEYPEKKLKNIPIKGVNYQIFSWEHPTESEMDESLNVIKNQLDCNGLQIMGETGTDELLMRCTETAIDKGFETIVVSPRYYKKEGTNVDNTIDEDIDKVVSFSKELEKLREKTFCFTPRQPSSFLRSVRRFFRLNKLLQFDSAV